MELSGWIGILKGVVQVDSNGVPHDGDRVMSDAVKPHNRLPYACRGVSTECQP